MYKNKSTFILKWAKKILLSKILGGKCDICGNNNIFQLEFHHPHEDKEATICKIKFLRFSKIKKEVVKCRLLCRNCHAELHYEDGGSDRRRSQLKENMLLYKNIFSCEICGYSGKNYRSLEFHHVKSKEKAFEISSEIWKIKKIKSNKIEKIILLELDKCSVICRNCHGIKHSSTKKFETFKNEIYKKVKSYKEYDPIDKNEVIRLHNDGLKNIEIAREIGCARSSITYILNRNIKPV